MTPKTTNPEILPAEGTAPAHNAAMRASAHQLAARLVRLDLDPETLEMIMAALATDICDHVNVAGGQQGD
jgi:hypothetical protein